MTNIQKSKIENMRKTGMSYGDIASKLNLSVNTVKSYCRRNNLNAVVESENNIGKVCCKVCGTEIIPVKGRKPRKFCSDKCREKWWNSHPEQVKQKAVYTFICPCCNKSFTAYGNRNRKYCSHSCYINSRFKAVQSV
jgi:uncharacterized protein YjcR